MLRFILCILRKTLSDFSISIHPMLRFIINQNGCNDPFWSFQYIPCYGLSRAAPPVLIKACNFNTSHVTVYRSVADPQSRQFFISIHPMLRFILDTDRYSENGTKFQYIPCYGLSGRQVKEGEILLDFNTSHVTVYRLIHRIYFISRQFQYIPCYGLSREATNGNEDKSQFQYIPCYGLSVYGIS